MLNNSLSLLYGKQHIPAKFKECRKQVAKIKAYLETNKAVVAYAEPLYESKLLYNSDIYKLIISTKDGATLFNRIIKIALDKGGKETEAANILTQAFDEGDEEALCNTLIRLEAIKEIKDQQAMDDVPEPVTSLFTATANTENADKLSSSEVGGIDGMLIGTQQHCRITVYLIKSPTGLCLYYSK